MHRNAFVFQEFLDRLTLNMRTLQSFYTSVAINHSTQRNIPEELNLQQNRCDNFQPHTGFLTSLPQRSVTRLLWRQQITNFRQQTTSTQK